jgi:hypothetical protein
MSDVEMVENNDDNGGFQTKYGQQLRIGMLNLTRYLDGTGGFGPFGRCGFLQTLF